MSKRTGRRVERPETESSEKQKRLSSPNLEEIFPQLSSFLSNRRDLGEIHQTGCITLFRDGSALKICLNDRPTRQSCFVSARTLWEALCRADRGLVEGSLTWSSAHYSRRPRKAVDK